jgi:hypothetical protein
LRLRDYWTTCKHEKTSIVAVYTFIYIIALASCLRSTCDFASKRLEHANRPEGRHPSSRWGEIVVTGHVRKQGQTVLEEIYICLLNIRTAHH